MYSTCLQGSEPNEGDGLKLLKWQGGKDRLWKHIEPLLQLDRVTGRYIEPFLGSGAVLFRVVCARPKMRIWGSDVNPALINLFQAVQIDAAGVYSKLQELPWGPAWAEDYYDIRDAFNVIKTQNLSKHALYAALLIWLNRHGFNGLYRESKQGMYTVPVGAFPKPPTMPTMASLQEFQALLQNVEALGTADFSYLLNYAQAGDVIYADPPYCPEQPDKAMFTNYSSEEFGLGAHLRLLASLQAAHSRGARVVLSNSSGEITESVYVDHGGMRVATRVQVPRTGGRGERRPTEEWLLTF